MARIFVDTAGNNTANDGLTLDTWILPLQARLPGATESLVRGELHAAIREFFLQSNAWREQVGPFNIYANNDIVWLNPVDQYSYALFVHKVWLETTERGRIQLAPATERPTEDRTGEPQCFSLPDPAIIRLWPVPDVTMQNVLWVDCTLAPLPDATRLPELAMTYHYEAILEGALARLLAIPNKPWTDFLVSARYAQTFRRRCIQARGQSAQGYARVDAPWMFPRFA